MNKSIVGLDIGASVVRGVQIHTTSKGPVFERAAEVPLPHGAFVDGSIVDAEIITQALITLWKHGGFSTKNVRIGMGGDAVLARAAELDWMRDGDFLKVLPSMAASKIAIEKKDYVFDYHTLSEYPVKEMGDVEDEIIVKPKRYVIIAGAKVIPINAAVAAVQAAHLHPISIDLNGMALLRTYEQVESDERGLVDASIDIGADTLTIILHKFGQPMYLRNVTGRAGNALTFAVRDELSNGGDKKTLSFQKAEYRKFEALYSDVSSADDNSGSYSFFDSEDEGESVPQNDLLRIKEERIARIKPALSNGVSEIIGIIRESLEDFFNGPMGRELTGVSGFSVSGGISNMPGFIERLGAEFKSPVVRATPFTSSATSKALRSVKPEIMTLESTFAIALGLAIGTGASHV